MSDSTLDIERVVREVLAEMGLAPAEAKPQPAPAPPPSVPKEENKKTKNSDPHECRVGARVVTMADVFGQLDAIRRVVVSPQAIVTPAVRDELIRRNIELSYCDSLGEQPKAAVRLTLVTMGTDFDPAALAAGLTREGFEVELVASDCIIAASDQLAAAVAQPNTLGVLLTRYTAAGLCLANRLQGVRAVTGSSPPEVAAASAAVGANVLVVDPRAGTFFQLKQSISEFCRSGVRPCPTVYKARLA